ncbi:hypothetical protein Ddc_12155 [Ditylenchus destructor]|nr:hypothetical protein Ddc_12155 [Ditylenchus destructor]
MMTPFQTIIFFLLLATIGNVNGVHCPDRCFSDAKTCVSDKGCLHNHCCGPYPLNNRQGGVDCPAKCLNPDTCKSDSECVLNKCCG